MITKEKTEEVYTNLRFNLESVKDKEGVIGYIIRNSKYASVEFNDPAKIIDYAMLSAESIEASEIASKVFQIGTVNSVVVEGNDIKVLSLVIDDKRISVFMNKRVDHNKIFKDLDLTKHSQKRKILDQNIEKSQEPNEIVPQ